jgi:hypothetical protein
MVAAGGKGDAGGGCCGKLGRLPKTCHGSNDQGHPTKICDEIVDRSGLNRERE